MNVKVSEVGPFVLYTPQTLSKDCEPAWWRSFPNLEPTKAMTEIGTDLYLQLPGELEEQILHPGRVVEVVGTVLTVELDEAHLFPESGQDVLIYYKRKSRFVKQSARIGTLLQTEANTVGVKKVRVEVETLGLHVSAEARQCYRVSTVVSKLTIAFGGCDSCPLADVSATGFAVISTERHGIGGIVSATPAFADLQCTGPVRIQSIRPLSNGRFRYGVHCIEPKLQGVMQQVSMDLQRHKLRQLACLTKRA